MVIGIDASRAFGKFWGGPESYSYYLIQAILKAESKHQFRLYLPPNAKSNPRFESFFRNLSIVNCQLSIIPWPRLWTQGGLALECLVNPPDVLFVPAHTLPILRWPGLKTVVTVHDLGAEYLPNYHKFPQKYYLNTMTEYAAANATKIIAVSEYTKKDIIRKFQISNFKFQIDRKIQVIYEGYDRGTFYPRGQAEIDSVKSKLRIEGDYFLFVGTIQPRKNLVRLIEAFSLLVSKRPPLSPPTKGVALENFSLVLAGAAGWLNQEIYDAPKKFGVENKVKFVGSVTNEDLPALMSGATAFVFPSLFEGFGLAPLEAMACGVPVILSKVTSLPEVGGEATLYVDPNSSSDIASKMGLVLSMSSTDRKLAVEKGLSQAQRFSWEKAALETLELIEAVAATSTR